MATSPWLTGIKSLAGQRLFYAGGEFVVFGGYTVVLFIIGAVLFFCCAARTDGAVSELSC